MVSTHENKAGQTEGRFRARASQAIFPALAVKQVSDFVATVVLRGRIFVAKRMKQDVDSPFAQLREWAIARAKQLPRPRGRPRLISEAELIGRRDSLVGLVEPAWGEIGWELKRARTLSDLVRTLTPLASQRHVYPTSLFLKEPALTCTPLELRRTRRALGKASEKSRRAEEVYEQQLRLVAEAKGALVEAGENAAIKEIVKGELESRQAELNRLLLNLEKAKSERETLEKKLQEQEAFFAQNELLKFLKDRRYAFTPRNLANAIAGLPHIGWRQSFRSCARVPCPVAVSIHYEVFKAVVYTLRFGTPSTSKAALRLFRNEVPNLPRKHARVRAYLSQNWLHMKEAIEECWKSRSHPGAFPYRLAALFAKSQARPRTALDRVLAAIELRQIESSKPSQ
ncbi:MAG: hypothetical protein A3B82_00050 [Methylophilales bacterium RIFCSPHIGHO2_02_FULL_57_10]|nr:MAG: hypothetical protein A3B82_00050 [Methylophilales bacterium RIFCSPHIGHO2_02_FULL_57_10]